MNSMTTKEIGDFGENMAVKYLEDKGYDILERNFRRKMGEIDIIADDDDTTVFVEVKTRKSNKYGEPSEYVDYRKQEKLKKTAMTYADGVNDEIRFDVIDILYEEKYGELFLVRINHIENAF